MKMTFWSHCQGLVLRLQQSRPAGRQRWRQRPWCLVETLEDRLLLSSTPAMVADIFSGSGTSNPQNLVAIGSTIYFTATDGIHGNELWKSDGTAAGTVMIKDINSGSGDAIPVTNLIGPLFTNVNGTLYFRADDGTHGPELWKSDGTAAGTVMVADINSGSASSYLYQLTSTNGMLYFLAYDATHGTQLWKSAGTAAGTVRITDFAPPNSWSSPDGLTNVNGTLFFRVDDGTHGDELWKSDGTAAGTVMVKDIGAGNASSNPGNLTNVNGTLFFTANSTTAGYELWKSDGTAAATVRVAAISPGFIYRLTNVNGRLFFSASDGVHGQELWKSDGTAASTAMVKDINLDYRPFSSGSQPDNFTNVNGTLFFTANSTTTGEELWKSDGTAAGTTIVKDIFPSGTSSEYYRYYNGVPYGPFPSYSVNSSNPDGLTNVNGTLFFQANGGADGTELWQSDGTAAGTVMIANINPGIFPSSPGNLTNVNGALFFTADDGVHGTELWALNGVATPSLGVSGFPPTTTVGVPGNFIVVAKNIAGTTNTGYTGTVHFTSTDPQAVLPSDYTFTVADNGTHTFAATLKTAGNQSISATDTQSPGLAGIESNILVTPSAAGTLTVSGFPTTTTAGSAGSFTVTAKNADGTANTSYTGTVHFTSTDPQAVLPPDYTFTVADNGTHTFAATLKTAGNQSIGATDTQAPGVTGDESSILVKPAAASVLTVSGFPSTTTAGVAHNFTVTLRDPYANIATGYTGTVRFTSSDTRAVLPANYTFTAGDAGKHTFSATLKTAGTRSITAADTLASALTAIKAGITVNAAAASKFLITAPSSVTAGVAFSLQLTVQDAFGNVVTGYTGTVRFTSTDNRATLPVNYTFTVADKGVQTFTGLVLRKKWNQKITITDTLNSSLTASVTENVT